MYLKKRYTAGEPLWSDLSIWRDETGEKDIVRIWNELWSLEMNRIRDKIYIKPLRHLFQQKRKI